MTTTNIIWDKNKDIIQFEEQRKKEKKAYIKINIPVSKPKKRRVDYGSLYERKLIKYTSMRKQALIENNQQLVIYCNDNINELNLLLNGGEVLK